MENDIKQLNSELREHNNSYLRKSSIETVSETGHRYGCRKKGSRETGRIGYVDALKGFAIFCVVVGHVVDGYLEAAIYPESTSLLYSIYNAIYSFHMPLFMMISGYVYAVAYIKNGIPQKNRIYRQIFNLVLVYTLFSIPFGLLKTAIGSFVNQPVSIVDVFLFWAKPISPYWYLYDLALLYLFFCLVYSRETNRYILLAGLVMISIVGQLISFPYFEIASTMYYAVFFCIGIQHRQYGSQIIGNKILTAIALAMACILFVLFRDSGNDMSKCLNNVFGVKMLVGFGFSLAVWFLFENVGVLGRNRILKILGRYSLEIYVIHCLFTAGLRFLLPKMGIENLYVCFPLNIVISIAIPILFAILCKKLHIHGYLFKPATYLISAKKKVKYK